MHHHTRPGYCDKAVPRPYQLKVEQTFKFVADAVRGATRVLEVGCGRGDVARLLGRDGVAVTAIDIDLPDPRPSTGVKFVHGDFFEYQDQPFDAIVFTSSLHHLPLERAIRQAARLLAPHGALIADEFDLDAPRPNTARWYYETQELLAAAELFPIERIDPATNIDPRMRWLDAHVHQPPLSTGRQMLAAIASGGFSIRDTTRAPYLYRYICDWLPDDDRGGRTAAHVMSLERKRIAAGTLDAAGLRVVAMKS